jgi:hypothetical protein
MRSRAQSRIPRELADTAKQQVQTWFNNVDIFFHGGGRCGKPAVPAARD